MAPIHALGEVPEDFDPQSDEELLWALSSWRWRIFSGRLYKITTKGDDAPDDVPEIAVPFVPNHAQRLLLANLHNRNIIPKARQLGFSTLIEILGLDQALFNRDQEVVVIAHTKPAATKLYRKKVCFAYDNLPEFVRALVPTVEKSQTQMVFGNGSSIEVTSSARGGTPHFLHISEMGKIAAKYPEKAVEITTGSLQGVPKNGLVFIESTAEGMGGAFYTMSTRAEKRAATEATIPLTPLEYRFHFFPWWIQPEYRLSPEERQQIRISAKEHAYFDQVEGLMDTEIDLGQRAWYVAKRDTDFADAPDLMWREYPSTPAECWQASTDGKYYAAAMATARKEGRICRLPILPHIPVNSFWDLGASDDTAVWLHQDVDGWDHWIRFHEASGAGYLYFLQWMESFGYIWGAHYLPHDADQKRQQRQDRPSDYALASPVMILREMRPSWTWHVVPRVQNIQHGIDLTRQALARAKFDAEGCKEGIAHIEAYSREFNTKLQIWHDHPRHDEHCHAADALRQHAQGYSRTSYTPRDPGGGHQRRRRATGLTA